MITYSNAYYKMLPIESEFVDFEIGYFKNNLRDLRYKFIKLFNKNLQLILFVSSSLVSFLFDYFGFVALFFLLSSVNISNKIIIRRSIYE